MNKDTLEGKWTQLKGKARETWGKITDDEFEQAKGDAQQLAGLVQERYGKTKEEAEKEVKNFYDNNPY
ncbi:MULTISPECIES: CsbD family protein [Paenalcaligenes]|uniref:CsbD family protein n=1 Tax=Paenalcaligenes hermetiae TaxID=1157987 RepID=A0ABP9LWI9_9BURK|nr:CsbD family protein [Paenalcaligenes sp.]